MATVLREMPYAISFSQRVHLFHNLVARDKEDHQGDRVNFLQGKAIHVHIRRNFIYEDAFEKLSPDNGRCTYEMKWSNFTECSIAVFLKNMLREDGHLQCLISQSILYLFKIVQCQFDDISVIFHIRL